MHGTEAVECERICLMSQTWTLLDTTEGQFTESWAFDGSSVGWEDLQIHAHRLRGGKRDGVDLISVQDGDFSWSVIPTRGMNLWKAQLADWSVGWNSPVQGPVHPHHVPVHEPSGLGWLDGFDELLARCGLESNGAPEFDEDGRLAYPLHGKISNIPASKVTVSVDGKNGSVSISGTVLESRFHFSKLQLETTLTSQRGVPTISIEDTISNLSASPAEAQMLYHLNLGDPVLDGGAQFNAPVKRLVPRNAHAASSLNSWNNYPAPQPGIEEQVYFMSMHADEKQKTLALLKNAHSTHGCCLRYDTTSLPYFSLWKNPTAFEDGYVTGLEPGTNFPNPRSFEGDHKRFIPLAPGEQAQLGFTLELLDSEEAISARDQEIATLQKEGATQVDAEPAADWCAD